MVFRGSVYYTRTPPLDWRRGMFRLWLLVSAAWIMSWGIYLTLSAVAGPLIRPEDFLSIPIVLFGPPLAFLLCGLATRWAIRGFRFEGPEQDSRRHSHQKVVPLWNEVPEDYVS